MAGSPRMSVKKLGTVLCTYSTVGAKTGKSLGLAEQTGSPHCHSPGSMRDPVSKTRA